MLSLPSSAGTTRHCLCRVLQPLLAYHLQPPRQHFICHARVSMPANPLANHSHLPIITSSQPIPRICAQTLLYREQQPLRNSFNIQSASTSKSLQQQSHQPDPATHDGIPAMQLLYHCICSGHKCCMHASVMLKVPTSAQPVRLSPCAGPTSNPPSSVPTVRGSIPHSTTSHTTLLLYKRVLPAPVVPALLQSS